MRLPRSATRTGSGVLVRDVAGDLYYIRRPQALDARSRERLEIFID